MEDIERIVRGFNLTRSLIVDNDSPKKRPHYHLTERFLKRLTLHASRGEIHETVGVVRLLGTYRLRLYAALHIIKAAYRAGERQQLNDALKDATRSRRTLVRFVEAAALKLEALVTQRRAPQGLTPEQKHDLTYLLEDALTWCGMAKQRLENPTLRPLKPRALKLMHRQLARATARCDQAFIAIKAPVITALGSTALN